MPLLPLPPMASAFRLLNGQHFFRLAGGTMALIGLVIGGMTSHQFGRLLAVISALPLGPCVAIGLTAFGLSLFWLSRNSNYRTLHGGDTFSQAREYDLRALTDALPAVVAYIDKDERYLSMNAYVRRLGLTPEYFVGNTMAEVLPAERYETERPFTARALTGERFTADQERVVGDQIEYYRSEYIPDRDLDGSLRGFFFMSVNITDQLKLEKRLRESEEKFRSLVENVREYAIISLDLVGNIASWNAGADHIHGYTASEAIGQPTSLFYPPEAKTMGLAQKLLEEARVTGKSRDEGWRVRKDETCFWAVVSISAVHGEDGGVRSFTEITRDQTESRLSEQALRSRESQIRAITNHLPSLVCYIDRNRIFRFNNALYAKWLRRPLEEITNRPLTAVYSADVLEQLSGPLERALAGEAMRFEVQFRGWDGTKRFARGTYVPDRAESGAILGVHGLVTDVTSTKLAEQALVFAAEFDGLTGLPNRTHFMEKVREVLAEPERAAATSALMFLDIDRFKAINDQFGHQAGDQVLAEFGQRLSASTRPADVVARLAGDEFVILLIALQFSAEAQAVAQKILGAMKRPFTVNGRSLEISTSIGIAERVGDETTASDWLRRADLALYEAKAAGRATFKVA